MSAFSDNATAAAFEFPRTYHRHTIEVDAATPDTPVLFVANIEAVIIAGRWRKRTTRSSTRMSTRSKSGYGSRVVRTVVRRHLRRQAHAGNA
jgi:hypothetical protein